VKVAVPRMIREGAIEQPRGDAMQAHVGFEGFKRGRQRLEGVQADIGAHLRGAEGKQANVGPDVEDACRRGQTDPVPEVTVVLEDSS